MKLQVQRPTGAFIAASWAALFVGGLTYLVGLWNATLNSSEKGFYAMSFLLSLFGAMAVLKNVRDVALLGDEVPAQGAGV